MEFKRAVLFLLPFLGACGGVSIVLKSPIQDQCDKAGVQGCPEIVDGALVYIEGDKPTGKDRMLRGAAQNAPEKVKVFAGALRVLPLDKIPGAAKYTTIILEIADILAGAQPAGAQPVGAPVAPPPPPGGGAKIVVMGLQLDGAQLAGIPDIEFDTAQATIKATAQNEATLRLLLLGGQTNPNITLLRVEGHTDSDGDPASNQALSERRAQAVVEWLIAHGIARERLHPVGCAARDPIFPNDSPEHKARNRRTEFDIEAIGGARVEGYTDACAPNPSRRIR
jgi:OOP family OmpA-OmpF porin